MVAIIRQAADGSAPEPGQGSRHHKPFNVVNKQRKSCISTARNDPVDNKDSDDEPPMAALSIRISHFPSIDSIQPSLLDKPCYLK